jgi:hypothetical protein
VRDSALHARLGERGQPVAFATARRRLSGRGEEGPLRGSHRAETREEGCVHVRDSGGVQCAPPDEPFLPYEAEIRWPPEVVADNAPL